MARKTCTIFLLIASVLITLSGCGHSEYYVKPPKGDPHCGALTVEQLELADGFIKSFVSWYNSVDISKPQDYAEFLDDDSGSYWNSLWDSIDRPMDASSSEFKAVDTITKPFTEAYEMLRYDVELQIGFTIDTETNTAEEIENNNTFMIPEENWQGIHDSLEQAIEYLYK